MSSRAGPNQSEMKSISSRAVRVIGPSRPGGRLVNWLLLKAVKLTAFYQEPKKNIRDFEARLEAATKRANETLEKLGDP